MNPTPTAKSISVLNPMEISSLNCDILTDEMPSLALFAAAASLLDAKRSTEDELQRRKAEDAKTYRPLSEIMAEMHQLEVNRAKS